MFVLGVIEFGISTLVYSSEGFTIADVLEKLYNVGMCLTLMTLVGICLGMMVQMG